MSQYAAADLIQLHMERSEHIHKHFGKMNATLVAYKDEDAFQVFQSDYYRQHGEHFCYTITEWMLLDEDAKTELHGQPVMIIKPRSELYRFGSTMLFSSKRYFTQRGKEFITLRDALGLSNTPYTPSHSILRG